MQHYVLMRWLVRVAAFLIVGLSLVTPAAAALGGCRADPIVVLSDGTVLDVTADIQTSVENVTRIQYTVHAPRGVKLVAVYTTPTVGFTGKETFAFKDDAKANQYSTETLVRTTYSPVIVTAYTTFGSTISTTSGQLTLQYLLIQGFDNQILRASLTR